MGKFDKEMSLVNLARFAKLYAMILNNSMADHESIHLPNFF